MKKRLFLILSLTMVFVALAQAADDLRVTSVKGKITFMTNNGQRLPLEVNDIVDKSTIINMPFHGVLELLDQSSKKRYTINVPGRAPISALLRDNRNSLENLTQQYVKTLVNEVTNNGKIKAFEIRDLIIEEEFIDPKQTQIIIDKHDVGFEDIYIYLICVCYVNVYMCVC